MEIIKLNLIPSGVNPTCHCSQYDNGRVIRIELFDGLTPYTLQSGDTVTLNVRKPDNTIVTTSLTATQGNKYVDLVTTEQICACVGYNLCDLTITNGSVVIGTLNFIMQVERDVLADGIPSQSVIEDLDELVQEAVGDNYYTKNEVDDALALKADKSTTYTKTEVDNKLADYYTKTEIDTALALKADKSELYNLLPTEQVSGAIANFTDGADNIPVKSLTAQIVATQAGSGDPSPSNIRSIIGFSSVEVYQRGGVNIFDKTSEGITTGKLLNSDGTEQTSGSYFISDYMLIKGNYTLTVSGGTTSGTSPSICFYDKDKHYISGIAHNGHTFPHTYTTPVNAVYCRETIYNADTDTVQIQIGSTATAYEAYTPLADTFTIDLGETIYGGVIDCKNGTGIITYGYVENLGNLNWTMATIGDNTVFYNNTITNIAGQTNASGYAICSKYVQKIGTAQSATDKQFVLKSSYAGSSSILVVDNDYSNAETFKTSMSGAQLVYELATPLTLSGLTPEEIKTLLGVNNIFSDSGEVDVIYRADIGLYIDKKISQIPTYLSSLSSIRSASPVVINEEDPAETPTNDEER